MADKLIPLARIVGGGICVAADDGNRVYDVIRTTISKGDRAVLNFEQVTRVTTAFLNAAVGQLYNEFSEEDIRRLMAPPINTDAGQRSRLKLVVDRAKDYFKDPRRAQKSFSDITGIDDADSD